MVDPSTNTSSAFVTPQNCCVLALQNSVGNSLPIMDSPKPVSQHYRILLATHCRLWTYQQLYTRTFSVTLFGKLTTYLAPGSFISQKQTLDKSALHTR